MFVRPLRLAGDGNDLVGVRGEEIAAGVVGLTLRVDEEATEDGGAVRWWETTMARRVMTIPWASIFTAATDEEPRR